MLILLHKSPPTETPPGAETLALLGCPSRSCAFLCDQNTRIAVSARSTRPIVSVFVDVLLLCALVLRVFFFVFVVFALVVVYNFA